jgi:hypothetical protein
MTENCKLRKAIFSAFHNISQRNFGILLILWCSFKRWWNFCWDQNLVYYASGQFDQVKPSQIEANRGLSQNARTWNVVQFKLEDLEDLIRINRYLKWSELILIQSDWINLDPVLGSIYFIRYPMLSCEQNKAIWLANLSWIINKFEVVL